MPLMQKHLFVKESKIQGAGKGLFTNIPISKGARIAEYKGRITTWKKVLQTEVQTGILNRYLFYVNQHHVIDSMRSLKALARYANDAKGLSKTKGLVNNCRYIIYRQRVFMEAIKDISAGEEILINYGKDYWKVIKQENEVALKPKEL